MSKYITKKQYKDLSKIPRDRLATRAKVYCGTIVEEEGKILLVLEDDKKYPGYDLPGGKLLWGENIKDCAIREFAEEGGFHITVEKLLGIYQRTNVDDESDYFRFIFVGKINQKKKKVKTDESVINFKWVKVEDVLKKKIKLRSTEVYREIVDYTNNQAVNLNVLGEYIW